MPCRACLSPSRSCVVFVVHATTHERRRTGRQEDVLEALTAVAVGLVMLGGLVGTLVPVVPGLAVIWLAGVVHGLLSGWDGAAWALLVALTLLAVAGQAASILLPARGATAQGATREGLVGGVLGALLGSILLPVLGLPIGAVLGVLVAERLRTGDMATAWRVTKGVLVGVGVGAALEFSAGVLMVVSWVVWLVVG